MSITIAPESPLQGEIRVLIAELNAYLLSLTPPEFCSHLTVEQMADEATTVFVARDENGRAVGIGALRREGNGIGQVKRMYTVPHVRRQHVGSGILDRIIALARAEGMIRLVLETGDRHHDAWRLYESRGFARCGRCWTIRTASGPCSTRRAWCGKRDRRAGCDMIGCEETYPCRSTNTPASAVT
jgi:putative acetyltransferase